MKRAAFVLSMKKLLTNQTIRDLIHTGAALGAIFLVAALGFYKCPLDFVFGIPCPMCGITRALLSVFRGDFGKAFYYHPLWPLFPLAVILYVLYSLRIIRVSRRFADGICLVLCVLLCGCFAARHYLGSPVVRVHFGTSLLGRIVEYLRFAGLMH